MNGFVSLITRRPPGSTGTDTPVPYTTLFRSRRANTDDTSRRTQRHRAAVGRFGAEDQPKQLGAPCPDQPGNTKYLARSEEHTSELQSLMRISYAVFCLKKTQN